MAGFATFFRRHWLKLIGPVVLVVILVRVDISAVAASLLRADLRLFLLSLPLAWLVIVIRVLRWRLLIGDDLSPPIGETFQHGLRSLFFGTATPGRVGELYRLGHVTRLGGSIDRALASIAADRVLDMVVLAAMATVCLTVIDARLRSAPRSDLYGLVLFLVALTFASGAGWALLRRLAKPAAGHPAPPPSPPGHSPRDPGSTSLMQQIRRHGSGVLAEVGRYRNPTWARCLAISIVALLIQLVQRWAIGWALGIRISFVAFGAVISLAALLSLLPISVNGIGIRDVALVSLLGLYEVTPADAIAVSSLVLLTMLTSSAFGLVALLLPTASEREQRVSAAASDSDYQA